MAEGFMFKVRAFLEQGNLSEALNTFVRYSVLMNAYDLETILEIFKGALRYGETNVKKTMIKLARRLKIKELSSDLKALIKEDSANISALAILALASLKDTSSIELIRKRVNSFKPEVRAAAVLALGSFEDPVSYPLIKRAMFDENPDVRSSAAASLGWYGKPDGFSLLIQRLVGPAREKDLRVRMKIIKALFWNKSQEVRKILEDLLYSSKEPEEWLTTAEVLYRSKFPGVNLLLKAKLIQLLDILRSAEVNGLIGEGGMRLFESDALYSMKEMKVQSYLQETLDPVLKHLAHSVWEYYKIPQEMRVEFTDLLDYYLSSRSYMPWFKLSVDTSSQWRASISKALKNLLPESTDFLIEIAIGKHPVLDYFDSEREATYLRRSVIDVLAGSKDSLIQIYLVDLLRGDSPLVQEAALWALIDMDLGFAYLMRKVKEILLSSDSLERKLLALGIIFKLLTSQKVK